MCGIVGAIGSLSHKHEEAFRFLLWLDTLRGMDSTGAVSIDPTNGRYKMEKSVASGFELLTPKGLNSRSFDWDSKRFERITQGANQILIGHNRAATRGVVKQSNAHPFHIGAFLGVHNGTLHGQHKLPDYHDFEVDSENIIHSFDKIGEKETLELLHGAYALVWWNGRDKTVNFARNKERPMFMCVTKDAKVIFFASEKGMLQMAMDRYEIEVDKYEQLPVGQLYKFTIPKRRDEFTKPKVTPFTVFTYTTTSRSVGNTSTSPWAGRDKKQEQKLLDKPANNVVDIGGNSSRFNHKEFFFAPLKTSSVSWSLGEGGREVTEKEMINILGCGCANCSKPVPFLALETVSFFGGDQYLCNVCMDGIKKDDRFHQHIH